MSVDLDNIINAIPSEEPSLPPALPLAHATIAKWFDKIVSQGHLKPLPCPVFHESLVYLFSGGVFYRSSVQPTRDPAKYPVAFVFHPSLLTEVCRIYPYDTGAMASGKFAPWNKDNIVYQSRFRVTGDGTTEKCQKLVWHLYGSNTSYLAGFPDPSCMTKADPTPELFQILTADLSPNGVDQRQRMIECQINTDIALDHRLLWVGYPAAFKSSFIELCAKMKPHVPQRWEYTSYASFRPSDIEAQLEHEARRARIEDFVRF